jgi:uncharacterized protein YndB with AHSA1/START domain
MQDRIEKQIDLNAPVERVWKALTDHEQFGQWFLVRIDQPFAVGQPSTGRMTYPGFEHMPWEAEIVALEEPSYFAFRWPPYYGEIDVDTSADPWTLVEFRLEPAGEGTRLTLSESGFAALPPDRAPLAFRGNEGGWEEQARNIRAYVER